MPKRMSDARSAEELSPAAEDVIRASEVGQYTYCARAWWLGCIKGYRPAHAAALREGRAGHRAHGRAVLGYRWLRRLAVALLLLAGAALAAFLVVSVLS